MKRITLKEQKELSESLDAKINMLEYTLREIEAGRGNEVNAFGITNFDSAKNLVSVIKESNRIYLK